MKKTRYLGCKGVFGWYCRLDALLGAVVLFVVAVALPLLAEFVHCMLTFIGPPDWWYLVLGVWIDALGVLLIWSGINRLVRPTLLSHGEKVWILDMALWRASVECYLPEQEVIPEFTALAEREVVLNEPTREGKKWAMTVGDYEVRGGPKQVGEVANWLLCLQRSLNAATARAASWLKESGCSVEEVAETHTIISPLSNEQWQICSDNFTKWQEVVAAREAELRRSAQEEQMREVTAATRAAIMAVATASDQDRALSLAQGSAGNLSDGALSSAAQRRLTGSFVPTDGQVDAS